MSGRYIFPYITGDFLPLSGGTITGDTVYAAGLSANTLSLYSGFTFNNGEAEINRVLVSIDNQGNSTWKDVNSVVNPILDGQNTFVNILSSSTVVNLVDSPSVNDINYSGIGVGNKAIISAVTAQTIEVGVDISPSVDNTVSLGRPFRRFRSLNTVNGVAVNFTATTINLGSRIVTESSIVLTGDTIDSGFY